MTEDKQAPRSGKKKPQNKRKQPTADLFTAICRTYIGVKVVKEFLFHPTRKWRFDYAIPAYKIAIEVDGGVWVNGRHNRATGYLRDLDKFNAAASMGWVVLKFTPDELYKRATFGVIKETVENRQNERDLVRHKDKAGEEASDCKS